MNVSSRYPSLLFVNFSKGWGGGEVWTYGIAQELIKRGFKVELMVWPNGSLHTRASEANIPCHPVRGRFLSFLRLGKTFRVFKKLQNIAPDVIFLNASHELKYTGLLAKWAGIKEIIYVRGLYFPVKPSFINRWYMRNVITGMATTAQSIWHGLLENFPILKPKKHLVLPTFIDPTEWQRTPNQRPISKRIGIVSRLTPEKGVARGIKAFALLAKKCPEAHLFIVGEGSEKPQLEKWVADHGLEHQVTFAGFTYDVAASLSTCEALVLPSYGEGGSIALKEAMAMEVPPVVFDVASMDEVIVHGETGFIVPDDDLSAMANALQQLIENPSLRKKMGEAGRKHVLDHFTIQYVIDQLINWMESNHLSPTQTPPESNT